MRARPNPLATAAPLPHDRDEPPTKTSYLPTITMAGSRPRGPDTFRDPYRGDPYRGGGEFRGESRDPYARGPGLGGAAPKESLPPQLIISGVNAEVSAADFHHFLSRWGQVLDSSVTMQGHGTATFATWAGHDAILAASPLRFKGMELVVRAAPRGPSPAPAPRRRYEEPPVAAAPYREPYVAPTPRLTEPVGIRETDRPQIARMTPGPRIPRERDTGLNLFGEPKLYVGGVVTSTKEELRAFMEQFGEVTDTVVMPKGFGFCTFKDAAGTAAALEASNLEFDGQTLTIQKARPRGAGEDPNKAEAYGAQPKLYVAGVGTETTTAEFKMAMSEFGEVFDCIVMPSGFGFCTYKDSEGTENALRSQIVIGEKRLKAQPANPKGGGDRSAPRGRDDYDSWRGRERGYGYDRDDYDRYYSSRYYDDDRYYDRRSSYDYDRRDRDYGEYDRYGPPRYAERRPAPPAGFCEEPKLYVGGVPNELSNEDFREFLSQYGEVHDCVVMGGGFGFATFVDSAATYKALGANMEIDGKKLTVQKAKPKKTGQEKPEWTTFENKRRKS